MPNSGSFLWMLEDRGKTRGGRSAENDGGRSAENDGGRSAENYAGRSAENDGGLLDMAIFPLSVGVKGC